MSEIVPSLSDLEDMIVPDVALLELALRISAVYLFLLLLFRFVAKREAGALNISNILVVVLVADAVQNGMSNEYTSLTGALVLAAVLIGWSEVVDRLSHRFGVIETIVKARPLVLIRNGRLVTRAADHEHLTKNEIMSQLRSQGVRRIEDVELAFVEPNGEITALPFEEEEEQPRKKRSRAARSI
jgi:uncharacterized membrane protein YcaP (DUF421 family)